MKTRIASNFDDSVETGVFAHPRADNVIVETVLIVLNDEPDAWYLRIAHLRFRSLTQDRDAGVNDT